MWKEISTLLQVLHNNKEELYPLWYFEKQVQYDEDGKVVLKVVSATFLLVCFLRLNGSTCQTKKYVFYFTSETLFVLKKIKF